MKKMITNALSGFKMIRKANKLLIGRGHRKNIILWLILAIITSQLWAPNTWLFGQITNKFSNGKSVFAGFSLLMCVAIIMASDVVSRIIGYAAFRIELMMRKASTESVQTLYWNSYAKYDIADREHSKMQDAINNASRNQDAVQELFNIQASLIVSTVTLIVSASMLASIEWWYIGIVILMVAPRIYLSRKRKLKVYKLETRLNEVRRYKGVIESYIGSKDASMNESKGYYLSLFHSIRSKINGIGYKNNNYYATTNFISDTWYFMLDAVLLFCVLLKVEHGEVPIGTIIIMFTAANKLYAELTSMTEKFIDLELTAKKSADFFLIIDSKPTIEDAFDAIEIDDTRPPRIEFDNVWFSYPESEKLILNGVNFIIEPGETIGLIAKNGEGKTTIGLLLLRFYDPTAGSIRINGIDLRLIKRSSLLKITGALFQDFEVLRITIKEAVKAGNPFRASSDYQIWNAIETVGLKSYVQGLDNKLNHKVNKVFKDSVKLSGGQSQKLALASLVYRNPKMVILDEFTSALDPEAEVEIIGAYKKIIADKTALIISHRYMSLKIVDRILVLKDGKIVEDGKKSELLQLPDGIFKKLYKAVELANSLN